jgi:excisionase family DNA binding protein
MNTQPELLTAREVCALLRISRGTLRRFIDDGTISVVRLGARTHRYRRADIDRILGTVQAL